MSNPSCRSNMTSVATACILSAGLVTAAIIDSHKPASRPAATAVAPSISQESAARQFREQLIGAPQLHGVALSNGTSSLSDVRVTHVQYSAKDDAFGILFNPTWESNKGMTVTYGSDITLTNDGYGHYFGKCRLDLPDSGEVNVRNVDVTIQ